MTNIVSIYDQVKKTYFPDWDRDNQWRVELKDTLTDGWLGTAFLTDERKLLKFIKCSLRTMTTNGIVLSHIK